MPEPVTEPTSRASDSRSKALYIAAIIAILVALIQRTPLGPLPHRMDDFLAGFAVGATLVAIGLLVFERPR